MSELVEPDRVVVDLLCTDIEDLVEGGGHAHGDRADHPGVFVLVIGHAASSSSSMPSTSAAGWHL